MNIRTRLTLQFIGIVAIILVLASVSIYYFSSGHRSEDFYNRLQNKANITAQLLIQFDEVDVDLLKRIEANNPVSLPNEKIIIFDYTDEMIYSTDEDYSIRITKQMLDEVRLKEKIRGKQGDYEVLGFLFTGQYDRFVVIAAAVDIFGWRKIHNLRNILLTVIGISIVLLLFSGWIYAGKMLKPISRVVSQVDEISITSLNLRLDTGSQQDEITSLAATFNKMLDRLELSFNSQKEFINNASHELRTPLTAITGQLEVVLMQERSVGELEKVIRSVLDDIRNLNTISNRLLTLAHASGELTEHNFHNLRIDEIIWQSRDDLIKRNPDYSINILFDTSLDDELNLTIKGDEHLLKTLVINIMENACKYSSNKSVIVSLSIELHTLVISFADQGIGICADDLSHIFEPFRRGQNAMHIKGHGIGLSLVERIILLHKGRVELDSIIDKGTTFRVYLPVKA